MPRIYPRSSHKQGTPSSPPWSWTCDYELHAWNNCRIRIIFFSFPSRHKIVCKQMWSVFWIWYLGLQNKCFSFLSRNKGRGGKGICGCRLKISREIFSLLRVEVVENGNGNEVTYREGLSACDSMTGFDSQTLLVQSLRSRRPSAVWVFGKSVGAISYVQGRKVQVKLLQSPKLCTFCFCFWISLSVIPYPLPCLLFLASTLFLLFIYLPIWLSSLLFSLPTIKFITIQTCHLLT